MRFDASYMHREGISFLCCRVILKNLNNFQKSNLWKTALPMGTTVVEDVQALLFILLVGERKARIRK